MTASSSTPPTASPAAGAGLPEGSIAHGLDGLAEGQKATARVLGRVEFRAGDGPLIAIEPDQRLELERAPFSIVLSWTDDGHPMNAAIPLVQFDEFIKDGKVAIDR